MLAMRIVLDTASFVSAVRSGGGAGSAVVKSILSGEVVALMDHKLGLEYREVALRPEHLAVSPLSREGILDLIATVEGVAEGVRVTMKHRPLSPDPKDDMVLDIAINGRADAIVTSNIRHFMAAAKRHKIAVLTPAQLLEKLRRGKKNADWPA